MHGRFCFRLILNVYKRLIFIFSRLSALSKGHFRAPAQSAFCIFAANLNSMQHRPVRVRFAPSPTGPLHIGGVRTALYNYLFARKHGGTFILRIEDTDQNRFVAGAEDYITQALDWCGIRPDESPAKGGKFGPYRQSERKAMYAQYALELVSKGWAYYAFDSEEEIASCREAAEAQKTVFQYDASTRMTMKNSLTLSEELTQQHIASGAWTIRFKMPEHREVVFNDVIRGEVRVNAAVLDDKVLMKSDGMPTYHLANIVDDHLMEISHVIRGEEWLPSAPLHVMLYEAFGWEAPAFAHLPLILKPTGNGKLSKRDGDKGGFPVFPLEYTDPEGQTSSGYRESGYYADAVVNMLLMLGWSPGTEQEIFTRDEMIAAFDLDRVVKSGARFNPDKARWFNEHYFRTHAADELTADLQAVLSARGIHPAGQAENPLREICEMMRERCAFVHEMADAAYLYSGALKFDDKVAGKRWKPESAALMLELVSALDALSSFDATHVEAAFHDFVTTRELGVGAVLPLFRLLVTGEGGGPSMFAIAAYLGKNETMKRMRDGIEIMQAKWA